MAAMAAKLTITLRPLTGQAHSLQVEPSASCGEFRAQAAAALGLDQPTHVNCMAPGGNPLRDEAVSVAEWGLKDGDRVICMLNFRGVGGIQSTPFLDRPENTLLRTRPTNPDDFGMRMLVGARIRGTGEEGDAKDGSPGRYLQYGEEEHNMIYAGGGPSGFELDGGGLRVRGAPGFDSLQGKKIEKIEYREWRAKGPGPGRAKTAEERKAAKTGAVIFLEGGAIVYATKNASGSEPANLVWIGCDGDEGGEFGPGYPAEDWKY